MFQYEQTPDGYWIWSEKISGKFGPFQGIYVKNIVHGDFPDKFDISHYPGYKYAFGKGEECVFIISLSGCEKIAPFL